MRKLKLFIFIISFVLLGSFRLTSQTVEVTFRVDMQNQVVAPEGVHIAGSFQGWNPAATAMTNITAAIWSYTHTATSGETLYYKFVNGDAWGEDESVPGACASGGNRFFNVPSNDVILTPVCYGSCLPCILPQVNITFRVDMSNETISPSGVFVQGSFQNPSWSGQQLTDMGNNIYAATITMSAGEFHEYKFLNGTTYETVPPACGWGGYSNRYLTVPAQNATLGLVCFGSCDPCTAVTDIDITFRVDMSEQTVAPEGVHIAGGFQGWNPAGTLLTDIGNGIWEYTATLTSGSYHEYKFVNGDAWGEDEQVPWFCANNGNRFITVPESNTVLSNVCYGSCLACNPPPVDVTFRVDMSLQQVSPLGVHVAGSFQGWNSAGTPMTDMGNNIYEVTLTLGEGEFHEYKFINGNDFLDAEVVPAPCANFSANREFFVPATTTTLDLVCFGECGSCVIPTHTFDLAAFLEGPFNGTNMNTKLDQANVIPTYQPYNVAPWNYMGNENLLFGPSSGIVDWVLVEFRSTDGDASTATADKAFYKTAALMMADGSITMTNGTSPLQYTGPIFDNLYVVIWHRNHLPVMSATALAPSDGNYIYDFTTVQSYLDGQKLINGVYCMIGGDSDANGTVNNLDKTQWNSKAGKSGYLNSDSDLDGQSDNVDKNDIWDNNNGLSAPLPLKCGIPFIDLRDGQSYNTVQIGTQCWMGKNLNIGTMIPGTQFMANNAINEKYCYNNSSANCNVYGGLYQWDEIMQYSTLEGVQGICPTDWHVPTDGEWTMLTDYLGGEMVAGGKMKETGLLHWFDPNNATNESNFTALPGGGHEPSGDFYYLTFDASFWSSTDASIGFPWRRNLHYAFDNVFREEIGKDFGFSVRCVQD